MELNALVHYIICVINVVIEQSGKSMESELEKTLKFLADNSVQVRTLITDRHKQIVRHMREQKPSL